MHKLRKKMFWTRNTNNTGGNSTKLNSSTQQLNNILPIKQQSDQQHPPVSTKPTNFNNKLLNSLKLADSTQSIAGQFRSNSLNYVGSFKQPPSNLDTHETINAQSKNKQTITNKSAEFISNTISNLSNGTNNSNAVNSTLKPFYSKLKKSHLFGVKLDKLCGPYSPTNNRLPSQVMVI